MQAVPGAVAGTQLPAVQQVVVRQQPAQHQQELVEADLVVLVLVCSPEQLRDVVGLLPALRGGGGRSPAQAPNPTARGQASTTLQDTATPSGRGQDTARGRIRLRGGDVAGTPTARPGAAWADCAAWAPLARCSSSAEWPGAS